MYRTISSPALKRSANFYRYDSLSSPKHLQPAFKWRPCSSCAGPTTATTPRQQTAKTNPLPTTPNPPTPAADHRSLGSSLDLFSMTPYSPGTPLLHADGSHIFLKLQQFLRAQYGAFGFREVVSPTIYKQALWEKSGHWTNYKDDMFQVRGAAAAAAYAAVATGVGAGDADVRSTGAGTETGTAAGTLAAAAAAIEQPGGDDADQTYGLKPMNCPGHCLLYASRTRSFRDLPIRYADFGALHRDEISGALTGLTRVRRFHQDDGHIFCQPSQVGAEIARTLALVRLVYGAFGLGPYKLVLSTRPAEYLGSAARWDEAERQLRAALDDATGGGGGGGGGWELNAGDGAFYGPKIDVILRDADGREHQTATVQLDFQLPDRFALEYATAEGGVARPVMVHRAVLGSLERFMALLLEHFRGRWPFWLSPRQLALVAVNDEPATLAYVAEVRDLLAGFVTAAAGAAAEAEPALQPLDAPRYQVAVDARPVTVSSKIAQAKADHYNLVAVVGKKEVQNRTLTVDVTGQWRIEDALKLPALKNVATDNLKAVKLTPDQLKDVMRELNAAFL